MYYLSKQCAGYGLPAPLAARYRMADGPALKVALFLLGGGAGEAETICDALSLSEETVARALVFWHRAGLLSLSPAAEMPARGADDLPREGGLREARTKNAAVPWREAGSCGTQLSGAQAACDGAAKSEADSGGPAALSPAADHPALRRDLRAGSVSDAAVSDSADSGQAPAKTAVQRPAAVPGSDSPCAALDSDGAKGGRAPQGTQTPAPASAAPVKRIRSDITAARAATLSLRDPAVAVLLQETQRFLGRTLDAAESRTLLELYACDELSVDVILMLVAYCVPRVRNKRALCTMVSRIADDWFEQGISAPADAEKQIRLMELREQREAAVASALELKDPGFSKSQKATIAKWFEEYGYDESFAREAYLSKGNSSIAFVGKILQGWYNNGFTSLRQVRDAGSAPNAPAAPSAARKKGGGSLLKKAVRAGAKEE